MTLSKLDATFLSFAVYYPRTKQEERPGFNQTLLDNILRQHVKNAEKALGYNRVEIGIDGNPNDLWPHGDIMEDPAGDAENNVWNGTFARTFQKGSDYVIAFRGTDGFIDTGNREGEMCDVSLPITTLGNVTIAAMAQASCK